MVNELLVEIGTALLMEGTAGNAETSSWSLVDAGLLLCQLSFAAGLGLTAPDSKDLLLRPGTYYFDRGSAWLRCNFVRGAADSFVVLLWPR
ncbi:hypothetical protein Nepgr_026046 [Nepenthes gracilis]|uniref:Uncharacterized protein n=1 Tax=Nepenthes gracilis TaxID=150966 RepID=A0AAD3T7C7_NEPGR|nr:hypothetical protein Nepgr_026046 [Nepenthes gracilis]